MPALHYAPIQVLIYDPLSDSRMMLRSTLEDLGFRNVFSTQTLSDFSSAIIHRRADIIFCAADGTAGEISRQIYTLRRSTAAYNPYAVVIATSWQKSPAEINRILLAGADDVLLRPVSHDRLEERLSMHSLRRKGFVLTYSYLGPDRQPKAAPTTALQFQPPNTLQMKAVDRLSEQATDIRLNRELPQVRRHLQEQKLRIDAFQLGVLSRFLEDGIPTGESTDIISGKTFRLAQDVAQNQPDISRSKDLTHWCSQIRQAIGTLHRPDERKTGLRLLREAVHHIYMQVNPDETEAEYDAALNIALTNIRTRFNRAGGMASQ